MSETIAAKVVPLVLDSYFASGCCGRSLVVQLSRSVLYVQGAL